MEYQHIDNEFRRNMVLARARNLEEQHYNAVLQKIANNGREPNPGEITSLETGIANLKEELKKYDETQADA